MRRFPHWRSPPFRWIALGSSIHHTFWSHLVYINIICGNVQPLSLLCLGVQLSVELPVLSMNEWYPLKSSLSSCISLTDDIHSSNVTLKICMRPDQCSRMTGTVVLHMIFEVLLEVYIQLWSSRIWQCVHGIAEDHSLKVFPQCTFYFQYKFLVNTIERVKYSPFADLYVT
jgi:hypothetical protein